MSRYPLIEQLGPTFVRGNLKLENLDIQTKGDWIRAEQLEEFLENAPVVSGFERNGTWRFKHEPSSAVDTHAARLIMIEPIERDTADSLLRELIAAQSSHLNNETFVSICERARKLLELDRD